MLVNLEFRRRRWVGGQGVLARITGSHCGGHATGFSTSVFREAKVVKVYRATASTAVARKNTGMRSVASFIV